MSFIRNIKPFNRRRYPRFEPDNCIEYTCHYADEGKPMKCFVDIVDISEGGALLISGDTKFAEDSSITIEFILPNHQEKNSINATVVRTYRREHGRWWYSGIEFVDKTQQGVKLLLDFVLEKP